MAFHATNTDRRSFLRAAFAFAASPVWASAQARPSRRSWIETREVFPEGVASGDPDATSVLLWTRRPYSDGKTKAMLHVEVAEDVAFSRVVASVPVQILQEADWTCRVLVGGLQPSSVYWYRFTDQHGQGSRVGRTRTAPLDTHDYAARFAFVSCQNVNQGAQNAYRRMIFDDDQAHPEDRLDFVLHLGDFIYEVVWYPEDRPQGMYDRRLRDTVRYTHGEKVHDFHIPTTLNDYRAVYQAYLHDPDLQDARAHWPFVSMWDNHEFSSGGWQSLQKFGDETRARQTRKVAANQAFFEYQPARMSRPGRDTLSAFDGPAVVDTPIKNFDGDGFGEETNNRIAVNSLRGYRALRWGRNVELIITDQRSFRSEDPLDRVEAAAFDSKDFPEFLPEEIIELVDSGRLYQAGQPPASIPYGARVIENYRRNEPAQTILGAEQKRWFLKRLAQSRATWKIWGNTTATLEFRADLQNLPPGQTVPWPGKGYAGSASGDHGSALRERGEIYDFVQQQGITGFATVAGDRHSFWAGLAAKTLPPKPFQPVGIAFVVGSLSAPGLVEALEHTLPVSHPLLALYLGQAPKDAKPQPTINLLLRHGVHSCLEYQQSGDIQKAKEASNAELSPHLKFVDMGGHGYAIVHATSTYLETEFICIPRPLERSLSPDGGQVLYRALFSTALWKRNEVPSMISTISEGTAKFSL